MNITSVMLAVVLWLVCVFAALVFFISRITSVRVDAANAIEKVNGRIDSYYDSNRETWFALAERVKKLEESKTCELVAVTDEVRKTSLYAITKVGYSTELVSLTDDELSILNSFIDWAALDDEFVAEKIDEDYDGVDWRNKK